MSKDRTQRLVKDAPPRDFNGEQDQFQSFLKAADELGADKSPDAFDRVLKKISEAPPPSSVLRRKVVHSSDCSKHNGPAYDAGPCDCGSGEDQS